MSLDEKLKKLMEMPALQRAGKAKKPKKQKRPKNREVLDPTRLSECSHSELVSIAYELDLTNVSRALEPEDIIFAILEGVENEDVQDSLEEIRATIGAYVEGNKSIMASMMPCDLNCALCPHNQVVECYTTNRDLVE